MDQKILINALEKQLDSLETTVSFIILIAIAIAWAGVQQKKEVEVLTLKLNRRHGFFAVSILYLLANMEILILFLRIGNLMQLLDQQNFLSGFTKLTTHSWVLNPFGYFGNSYIARLHSGEGYGLLIVIWWLCNASLSTLMDDKKNKYANIILGLFLVIGLCSMVAIQFTRGVLLSQLKFYHQSLYREFLDTTVERTIGTFLGIFIGGLLFTVINVFQNRMQGKEK